MIGIKGKRSQQWQRTRDIFRNVYKCKGICKVPKIPLEMRMTCSAALCNVLIQYSNLCSHNTLHNFSEGVHFSYYVQLKTFKCWNIIELSFASKNCSLKEVDFQISSQWQRHGEQKNLSARHLLSRPYFLKRGQCIWYK